MTDRELLELAAKAAGLPVEFDTERLGFFACGRDESGSVLEWWNPLQNDGDALRLAVVCNIDLEMVAFGGRAIIRDEDDCGEQFDEESTYRTAATRRAIVRAAASQAANKGGEA